MKVGSHRGLHVLAAEEFLGRRLLGLFTGEAREKVIINVEAPADQAFGPQWVSGLRAARPVGASAAPLTADAITKT